MIKILYIFEEYLKQIMNCPVMCSLIYILFGLAFISKTQSEKNVEDNRNQSKMLFDDMHNFATTPGTILPPKQLTR